MNIVLVLTAVLGIWSMLWTLASAAWLLDAWRRNRDLAIRNVRLARDVERLRLTLPRRVRTDVRRAIVERQRYGNVAIDSWDQGL